MTLFNILVWNKLTFSLITEVRMEATGRRRLLAKKSIMKCEPDFIDTAPWHFMVEKVVEQRSQSPLNPLCCDPAHQRPPSAHNEPISPAGPRVGSTNSAPNYAWRARGHILKLHTVWPGRFHNRWHGSSRRSGGGARLDAAADGSRRPPSWANIAGELFDRCLFF